MSLSTLASVCVSVHVWCGACFYAAAAVDDYPFRVCVSRRALRLMMSSTTAECTSETAGLGLSVSQSVSQCAIKPMCSHTHTHTHANHDALELQKKE